ncbi:MAG: HIT family protein [Actinomycetota bacterium]|nr:HIT family protein [Actinomycetota bacterium]
MDACWHNRAIAKDWAGTGCLFCQIAAGEAPAHITLDESGVMGFLDIRPLFPGHVIIIPKQHVQTVTDLPPELVEPVFTAVGRAAAAVEAAMGADGTFIAINNRVSQSVPHLHIHVVPRKRKDGLRGFMWPRQRYPDEAAMAATAGAIRAALGES